MKGQIAVLCSAVVLFGAGSALFGAHRLVPSQYPAIQAAIDKCGFARWYGHYGEESVFVCKGQFGTNVCIS